MLVLKSSFSLAVSPCAQLARGIRVTFLLFLQLWPLLFSILNVPNAAQKLQYKKMQDYIAANKLLYKIKIKMNQR